MVRLKKLQTLKKRNKALNEIKKLEESEPLPTVQLNLTISADLKQALQKAYSRNLTRLFEELCLERLDKDGFLKDDSKKSS